MRQSQFFRILKNLNLPPYYFILLFCNIVNVSLSPKITCLSSSYHSNILSNVIKKPTRTCVAYLE